MNLEPPDAVRRAKKWLTEMFADERIGNIGLEEVRWSDGRWEITLGFSRAWEAGLLATLAPTAYRPEREYKVVVISDSDQSIVEMRNREAA